MCAKGYGVGKAAVFDKQRGQNEGKSSRRDRNIACVTGQVMRSSDSCTGNKMLCFQSIKGSHSLKTAVLRGPFTRCFRVRVRARACVLVIFIIFIVLCLKSEEEQQRSCSEVFFFFFFLGSETAMPCPGLKPAALRLTGSTVRCSAWLSFGLLVHSASLRENLVQFLSSSYYS